MWIFRTSDGTEFRGDRAQIAKQLNFFEDVYEDEVWDKFCSYYTVEYVEEPIDMKETIAILKKIIEDNANRKEEDDLPF
ncbi:hypothetical protein [uncultured Methanobrevibacter sp.]|uniref:hypothetical protein n=1 Tax=uncultured Methanobrevibacter sp. TaxID=253161 RepID=UPI0025EA928E|nr:hypothetical protein [uncultured Methanobrevibacter sp.]